MSQISTSDLAELSEPFIDDASRELYAKFMGEELPALAEQIPIAKILVVANKIFNSVKKIHRFRMMSAFLDALSQNKKSMEDFQKLPEDDKNYIRGLVVSQLDLQTDVLQAEAVARLVDAYISKKIDRLTFIGVLSEIKNTNPLVYYFSVDSIEMSKSETGGYIAKGATELLPAAFGHNTVTGIGLLGSTGEYKYVVSRLGQAFFDHVYEPMCQKYMI